MQFKKNKNLPEQGRGRRHVQQGANSPAFSYYNNRSAIDRNTRPIERAEPAKGGNWHKRLPRVAAAQISFWLLLAVATICLAKFLFLSTNPKIIVVDKNSVANTYAQSVDIYTKAAHKQLTRSIFNHTKLTANLNGVARSLESQFPELQTVSVNVPLASSRPVVYVQLAQPSVIVQTAKHGNFALNKNGLVLASAQYIPQNVSLLIDQSNRIPQPGKQLLPGTTIAFLRTLAYQLQAGRIEVGAYVLPAENPYELDARPVGKSYTIRFNLQTDALQQSGVALAVLQQLGGTTPATYLDVRVPERAYYK